MFFCTECGAKLEDGSVFCEECGAQVGGAPAPTQQPGETMPQPPVEERAAAQTIPPQENPLEEQWPEGTAPPAPDVPFEGAAPPPFPGSGEPYQTPGFQQQPGEGQDAPPAPGMPFEGAVPPPPGDGQPYQNTPVQQPYVPVPAGGAPAGPKAGFNKLLLIIPIAVVVLIGVVVLGASILSGSSSGDNPIVYVKDNYTLRFYSPSMKDPVTITSSLSMGRGYYSLSTLRSENGRYLLYLDTDEESGNLYMRNIDKEAPSNSDKSDKGIKLSSDVGRHKFWFTADNKYAVYLRTDGSLYYHDFEESYKLDSDVYEYGIQITDNNLIIYGKEDGNGYIVYTQQIGSKQDSKVKVDSDVYALGSVAVSDDGNVLMYAKRDDDGNQDLYTYDLKREQKDKIASYVNRVIRFDPNTSTAVYTKLDEGAVDMMGLLQLDDDMLASDQTMSEPKDSDFKKTEDSVFGQREVTDWDAYYEAWEVYSQKEMRDQIREYMSDAENSADGLSIYVYKNGQEDKVAGNLISDLTEVEYASIDKGYAIYLSVDIEGGSPVKMSSFESYYDFYDYISDMESVLSSASVKFYYLPLAGGEASQFYATEFDDYADIFHASEDGKTIIFGDNMTSSGAYELYTATVGNNGVSDPVKLDDDVYSVMDYDDSTLLYMKDVRDEVGDLYVHAGGKKERLASDVYAVYGGIYNDGKSYLYFQDWNDNRSFGDLYLFTNKSERLSADVYRYYYRSDKLIYILKDYNTSSGRGDLFLYNGKDLQKVDDDVNYVAEG